MQSGGAVGMQTMDNALMKLVDDGKVSGDQAYLQANNKTKFRSKREGNEPDPYYHLD